jgi:hypothetical protein
MATERLDIFRVLGAADAKQEDFYEKLTDEERKTFLPFLVTRWMSGTQDPGQIVLINEFANPYMFSLTSHKQLLWQLLTVCNSGRKQRYVWNKLPAKRESGKPTTIKVIRQFFKYSTKEAVDVLDILSRDDIIGLAEQLGWQPDEIAKIRRELKVDKEKEDTPEKPVKGKKPKLVDQLLEY